VRSLTEFDCGVVQRSAACFFLRGLSRSRFRDETRRDWVISSRDLKTRDDRDDCGGSRHFLVSEVVRRDS
jgi:hypothetical protein